MCFDNDVGRAAEAESARPPLDRTLTRSPTVPRYS
jgi:hypothetical protein